MDKPNELITALDRNDIAAFRSLLQSGYDTDARDRLGRTALMYASLDGKLEFIEALIAHKTDVDAQDKNGYSALHFAAQDYRPDAVRLLCEAGAKVDVTDKFGNTPLGKAVFNSRGRGEVIGVLLSYGADRNKKNNHDSSPLDLAELIANYDVRQFL